jgi:hypothetical protein
MKFNPKKLLVEEDSGVAGGYLGYASDAESYIQTPYKGLSDPRNSIGAFGSVYQNKEGFKPLKALDQPQLDQLQSAVFSYLAGVFADPRQAIYNLKVKLNHLGFDFKFDRNTALAEGPVSLQLSRFGEKFGTTPTTNLANGFDYGQDYTNVALSFNVKREPSGQFCFENISIGGAAPQAPEAQQAVQAENFYYAIGTDNHLCEKLFRPIMQNILEKAENNTLTDLDVERQLGFIVERSAKYFGMNLTESDVENLTNGLYKILFEEEEAEGGRRGEGNMDNINAMARAKKLGDNRREKRALAIKRMKEQAAKDKGK